MHTDKHYSTLLTLSGKNKMGASFLLLLTH